MSYLSEEDYHGLDLFLASFDSLIQSSAQKSYIIDYFRKEFVYTSGSLDKAFEKEKLDVQTYLRHIPGEEQEMLMNAYKAGFEFFHDLPINEIKTYTMSYDIHLFCNGKQRLVHHKLTPIRLTLHKHIWMALCNMQPSIYQTPGHIIILSPRERVYYEFSLQEGRWATKQKTVLKELERDILILSARGLDTKEIAAKTCKSEDTIKSCKRALFKRLEVENTPGALGKTITLGLL